MNPRGDKKLSVLFVCIDSSLGGSTLSLYNLIETTNEDVHPIVLFPERGVGSDFFIEQGIECYIHPFVKLYRFTENRLADVWTRPWRWHRIKKIRIDLGCALSIRSKLKGRIIDIVHTNTSPNDVGVYLARLLGAKHVWHIRECLDAHAGFQMYGGMSKLRRQINHADARIAVSSFVKEYWNLDDRNTYIIPCAVCSREDAVYSARKESTILFVSYNLTETKGTRRAIKAFGLSHLADDGYKLVLVGNCKEGYRESLMDTARGLNCGEALEFVPCQADVRPYYETASVLIQPSEFEGLGLVVAEAMFYGCPVVAHASGGTLDLVENGKTGFLFHTLEECAGLLRKVCLENQEKVILQAQEFIKCNLSLEEYGPKIMEVYNRVMTR